MSIFSCLSPADFFTLLNISFGWIAIQFSFQGNIPAAVLCLLAGAVADGFDGMVAKKFPRNFDSHFGTYFDSIADVVTFVVAPAFLYLQLGTQSPLEILGGLLFVGCGALRLTRYCCTAKTVLSTNLFQGMPTTANAIIMPLVWVMHAYLPTSFLLLLEVLTALLMISDVPFPKLSFFFKAKNQHRQE